VARFQNLLFINPGRCPGLQIFRPYRAKAQHTKNLTLNLTAMARWRGLSRLQLVAEPPPPGGLGVKTGLKQDL